MTTSLTNRVKKSYSISREAEQFIRRIRKARKIASDSEALDQILRESHLAQSRASIDLSYTAFYDTAPADALEEDSEWASFAALNSSASLTEEKK